MALQIERPGAWSDRGEVIFEKVQTDPEVAVEHDILTVAVPSVVLPIKAGGAYRVMLEHNSGHAIRLTARKGRVGAAPEEEGLVTLTGHTGGVLSVVVSSPVQRLKLGRR